MFTTRGAIFCFTLAYLVHQVRSSVRPSRAPTRYSHYWWVRFPLLLHTQCFVLRRALSQIHLI